MVRPTRQLLTERVRLLLDVLRNQIREGTLQHGEYLPSEVALGKEFRLSKESVRRALDELVAEGLVRKIRRVGNQVIAEGSTVGQQSGSDVSSTAPGGDSSGKGGTRVVAVPGETGITIRLAYYPKMDEEALLPSLVAEYEREHPGIRVQLLPCSFPHEYAEHGMADVFTVSAWDALKLKGHDPNLKLMGQPPLGETVHPMLAKPFLDSTGRAAAAPFVYSPVMLCYNRDHFQACSLEEPHDGWTWYTLLKNARVLARSLDVWGFAVHIQSLNRWPVFLLQNGFRFRLADDARASEDPALWESLRVARDLIHQQRRSHHLLTENDADIERWFKEGKASMIMTTYYGMNRLRDAGIRYGVAALPALRTSDTLLLVTGLAVNRSTRHPEASLELICYLCGEKAQSRIRRHTVTLPVHPGAASLRDGLEGNRPEGEEAFAACWPRCRLYDDLNLGAGVLVAIREELKGYWSRLEDEAEASERLEQLFLKQ
ncbi:extracellular solute-binding protein [Paenibacillus mesophilus]|uniref:extracellular solute-binding protein n=1 Tax=Paenibacillus mesophilus TaxID=2582849 RepID=UPI00110DA6B2|nr:extracellular solute-binding protein [Paenibacillus mesophilus]TMV50861.1 extracellular solute-binding protein [Paenibacillus mesophilus]